MHTYYLLLKTKIIYDNSLYIYIYIYIYRLIGIMDRVFANDPGDWGSIPGHVIPKTKKIVLDASLLNTQHSKVWIKSKLSNPGKGVVPYPTPQCSNYWKRSLQVTLDYGLYIYIYIYIYISYLPTPLLGQDMTQGQFLSRVLQVWIQFSFS